MCGIIAYIGKKPADQILLTALKRMEYRGYDSAGVAGLENKKLKIVKSKGKLSELRNKLISDSLNSQIGIGHTRWATHGEPNDINAHPHQAGPIAIVHNGIIENYNEIKAELLADGVEFKSQTDTEILAQLINKHYQKNISLEDAVYKALNKVRGTYGLVVLSEREPRKLVVAREASPIVIGTKQDEVFVASDPAALAGYADEVIYLDDGEVAILSDGKVDITDLNKTPRSFNTETLEIQVEKLQKQGYDHFLIKEIMEQPESIKGVLAGHLDKANSTAHLGGLNISDQKIREIERIIILGCGTASYAGQLAKYFIERVTDIPVDVEVASEFRYREPVIQPNTLGIVISQSGETADTMAALNELKQKGVHTLGLVNVVGSSIARAVDGGVYLHAGPEISVASTKAFTAQAVAAMLVGLFIARRRNLPANQGADIVNALENLPKELANALKLNSKIKRIAKQLTKYNNALYLGRDFLYPIALEGALKLKEVSYIHAEGYPAGEMKHGPIALIDENFLTVMLISKGPLAEKSASNLEEIKARGGSVLVVTDDEKFKGHKNTVFVPSKSRWTAPLVMNVVLQLLAYHMAVARGTDVDQPRNLAKSVTVE